MCDVRGVIGCEKELDVHTLTHMLVHVCRMLIRTNACIHMCEPDVYNRLFRAKPDFSKPSFFGHSRIVVLYVGWLLYEE